MLTIEKIEAVSSKTNKPYQYISINIDGLEITRVFIKPTENTFFDTILGRYDKVLDSRLEDLEG